MVKSKKTNGESNLFRLLLSRVTLKKSKRISFYKKFIFYYSFFNGRTLISNLFGNLPVIYFVQGNWAKYSKSPIKNLSLINLKKKWITAESSFRVFTHLFSVILRIINVFHRGRSPMTYLGFFFIRFHSRFDLFFIFKRSIYHKI